MSDPKPPFEVSGTLAELPSVGVRLRYWLAKRRKARRGDALDFRAFFVFGLAG
jgi:hypothetical protein